MPTPKDVPMHRFTGLERGEMNQLFTPAVGATFLVNKLLVLNTGTQLVDECGADPAAILGRSVSRADQAFLWNGRVPVEVIDSNVDYVMGVSDTVGLANTMKAYGVVKLASGNWVVDISETSATVCTIVHVDIVNQLVTVRFLASVLQADSIAS